jgi:hypothetical protein
VSPSSTILTKPCAFRFSSVWALKEEMSGRKFRSDEEIQEAVHDWLCKQPNFSLRGMQALVKCCNKCVERNGDYVEK